MSWQVFNQTKSHPPCMFNLLSFANIKCWAGATDHINICLLNDEHWFVSCKYSYLNVMMQCKFQLKWYASNTYWTTMNGWIYWSEESERVEDWSCRINLSVLHLSALTRDGIVFRLTPSKQWYSLFYSGGFSESEKDYSKRHWKWLHLNK